MQSLNRYHDTSKRSNFDFFTLMILLSPILKQYASGVPGITLADLLLGVGCALVVLKKRLNISLRKSFPLIQLAFIGALISTLSLLYQQELSFDIITRTIRFSFYVAVVVISSNYFNLEYAKRVYKFLCIGISLYLLVQLITYNTLGIVLPHKILPIPLFSGSMLDSDAILSLAQKYYYRPTGIFVEPGFAAQFLLPGLVFSIYGWKEEKKLDIRTMILIFAALIASTSSQGIFLGLIVMLVSIFPIINKTLRKHGPLIACIVFILIPILVVVSMKFDLFQRPINKVTGDIRQGSSTALRLYRGFAVYAKLPTLYQIIGIGFGNLGNFVMKHQIRTIYDYRFITKAVAEYVNDFSRVLLYYGVVGFVLYLRLQADFFFKASSKPFKLIAFLFLILNLISGSFFSVLIVFYCSFIYSGYKTNRKEEGLHEKQ